MENLFELLILQPILSIICIFAIIALIIILFRKQISEILVVYFKKKYDLYTEEEIREAFHPTDFQMSNLKKRNHVLFGKKK